MSYAMQPVQSSQIEAIGYDAEAKLLAVRFRTKGGSGPLYEYQGVPANIYQNLLGAESKGKFFTAHVKHAGYRYAKVGAKPAA